MGDSTHGRSGDPLTRERLASDNTRHLESDPTGSSELTEPNSNLKRSFGFALFGLAYAVRTQRNMRIHLVTAVLVSALGIYLGLDWTQWAVLGLTIGFVLVAELFNTVAEAALDAATPHYHPLVKIAKDVAAAAVLLTAIISVLVGLFVLGPPLLAEIAAWIGD